MKGQVQNLEPILVIVILGVLAGIAVMFFFRVGEAEHEREVERVEELQAVEVLKVVTTMPELSCPRSVTTDTFCIDLAKAEAFSAMMSDDRARVFYQPLFGNARVTLSHVDLATGTVRDVILYDLLRNGSDTRATSTHFTVHHPTRDERQMALLTVQREAR